MEEIEHTIGEHDFLANVAQMLDECDSFRDGQHLLAHAWIVVSSFASLSWARSSRYDAAGKCPLPCCATSHGTCKAAGDSRTDNHRVYAPRRRACRSLRQGPGSRWRTSLPLRRALPEA